MTAHNPQWIEATKYFSAEKYDEAIQALLKDPNLERNRYNLELYAQCLLRKVDTSTGLFTEDGRIKYNTEEDIGSGSDEEERYRNRARKMYSQRFFQFDLEEEDEEEPAHKGSEHPKSDRSISADFSSDEDDHADDSEPPLRLTKDAEASDNENEYGSEEDTDDIDADMLFDWKYVIKGKFGQKALIIVNMALSLCDDDELGSVDCARLFHLRGQILCELSDYEHSIMDFQNAIEIYEQHLELFPKAVEYAKCIIESRFLKADTMAMWATELVDPETMMLKKDELNDLMQLLRKYEKDGIFQGPNAEFLLNKIQHCEEDLSFVDDEAGKLQRINDTQDKRRTILESVITELEEKRKRLPIKDLSKLVKRKKAKTKK